MPTPATENRRLAISATTNWMAFAVGLSVTFFLAPYMISKLGDDRYGVWCVVESVLAYFTLFDLGIAACLVRFVARYDACNDRFELNKLISACTLVFTVAGFCVIAASAVLIQIFGPILEARLQNPGDVNSFLILMALNLAITLPLSVFPSVLDGLQRYPSKSAIRLLFLFIKVAGVVAVMETTPGLLSLAVVFTVVNLLEHAALAVLVFRFLPGLRISAWLVDRETVRAVRSYSGNAFLAMLAGRITVQTGAVVAGGYLNVAAAAHYAIAARLVEMAKNLLRSVTTTLTPAISERESRGDLDGVRHVFLTATRWVLYLVLPVHMGLLAYGRPFFARWIENPLYANWCYPVAAILSVTLTIGVAQSVASRILYGMGNLRLFARLALVEAALNLLLSLLLVGPYGLIGVAIAVSAPSIAFCLFVIVYTARNLNVSLLQYVMVGWLWPVVAALVPGVIWWQLPAATPTWSSIAISITCGLIPYAATASLVEFGPLLWNRFKKRQPETEPPSRRDAEDSDTKPDLVPLASWRLG